MKGGAGVAGRKGAEFRVVDLESKPANRLSRDLVLTDHFDKQFSHSIIEPAHYGLIIAENDYLSKSELTKAKSLDPHSDFMSHNLTVDVLNQDGRETQNTELAAIMIEAATNATSYGLGKDCDIKMSQGRRSISFDIHSEMDVDIRDVKNVGRKNSSSSVVVPFETSLDPME
jgi:hypothetical protein